MCRAPCALPLPPSLEVPDEASDAGYRCLPQADDMHVVGLRADGLDSMCTKCVSSPGSSRARPATGRRAPPVRRFSALPDGLQAMTDSLRSHGGTAATMEGASVYRKTPVGGSASCSGRVVDRGRGQFSQCDMRGNATRRCRPAGPGHAVAHARFFWCASAYGCSGIVGGQAFGRQADRAELGGSHRRRCAGCSRKPLQSQYGI